MKIRTDLPFALSLAGGGSLGAWEAGGVQALVDDEPGFDRTKLKRIVGTSTGALVGAMVGAYAVTGDYKFITDMVHIYRNVLDGNILQPEDLAAYNLFGVKGLLLSSIIQKRDSLFNTGPLRDLVDNHMDDVWSVIIEAAQNTDFDLGFCCVNMQTGQPEVFWASESTRERMRAALIASTAQPVVMDPVMIGGTQYCDGGLTDAQPARHLLPRINEDMTVLALTPDKKAQPILKEKEFPTVLDQLTRTLSIFVGNVYATNIEQMELGSIKHKNTITTHWFEPEKRIKHDALSFKQPALSKLVDRGFRDVWKKTEFITPEVTP